MSSFSFKAIMGRALRGTGSKMKEIGNAEIFSRHRPILRFQGKTPFTTNDTFVAPTASIIGDVTCWDQSSIWYKAVVRADSPHGSITIGFNSSVGEGTVVTTELPSVEALETTGFPPDAHIGHYVTIGAGCVLKSCRIDDIVEIGDKCVILQGALVEHHTILEPGSLVMPYQRIPSGQKWGGNPAVFIADLTPKEQTHIQQTSAMVRKKAYEHFCEFLPYGNTYVHLEELEKSHHAATQNKPMSG